MKKIRKIRILDLCREISVRHQELNPDTVAISVLRRSRATNYSVSETTCYVSTATLNSTYSLIHVSTMHFTATLYFRDDNVATDKKLRSARLTPSHDRDSEIYPWITPPKDNKLSNDINLVLGLALSIWLTNFIVQPEGVL